MGGVRVNSSANKSGTVSISISQANMDTMCTFCIAVLLELCYQYEHSLVQTNFKLPTCSVEPMNIFIPPARLDQL